MDNPNTQGTETGRASGTTINEANTPKIVKYDGCSGGMSALWNEFLERSPPWEGCCDAHDQPYSKGGTRWDRLEADFKLRDCVAANGHPVWAFLMFYAVRIGGHPLLPFPWRWGS